MTYHALENRMRRYKKEATTLKDEAADRDGAVKSPMKTRTKKSDAGSLKGGTLCEHPLSLFCFTDSAYSCQEWANHQEGDHCYKDQV
jgi:hypothetical protein